MLLEETMPTEEMMNIDERYKYLRIMRPRYLAASRAERGRLLDEMERITGLARKSLLRLLPGALERQLRQQQRKPTYGPAVTAALAVIAESWDYICAERLTPNLPWMAQHLEAHGELQLSDKVRAQLAQISISSVQRRLAAVRQDTPQLHRKSRPTAGVDWRHEVPMLRLPWDQAEPGHLEVDLVHHCGPSASGEYAHTVQWVDIATGWSERVAVLGRGYRVMADAFQRILRRVPFAVREIHPDNGSEFFNAHMERFWKQHPEVHISRSRPYRKNDNRFVEQKNASLVRDYLGYDRLDTVAQVVALHQLYDAMWVYYNLFQPVLHLVAKEIIPATPATPARLRRHHDDARPPFDRLCATGVLPPARREQLERLRDRTNPRRLRQAIHDQIEYILTLPGAVPGQPQDVSLTLGVYTISWDNDGSPVTLSIGEQLPVR
jgi:hypothetical protein